MTGQGLDLGPGTRAGLWLELRRSWGWGMGLGGRRAIGVTGSRTLTVVGAEAGLLMLGLGLVCGQG